MGLRHPRIKASAWLWVRVFPSVLYMKSQVRPGQTRKILESPKSKSPR